MAEIKPLRAWRYAKEYTSEIGELVSPLFDVVSEEQREKLYAASYNSIHISVPNTEKPSLTAAQIVSKWKADGVIKQDHLPSIYVYYQYFTLPGSDKELVRKGFIANMRIYDWDEKVLLRHENTIPFSVEDRIDVLRKTQMNVSPTHGLYTDESHSIESYLDQAMENPIYETEDYQGVRDVFAVIQDASVIHKILKTLVDKQVILADGHHRYEGSLLYQKECAAKNPAHTGREGYNYHMMYFTNTESDDLRILPTHRLISGLQGFSKKELLNKLEKYFHIKSIDESSELNEVILGKKWAFGLLIEDSAFKIRLKEEKISSMTWNFPQEIKELDLTVLHYFVIEKCLGIKGTNQRSSGNLRFERSFIKCINAVTSGESQCALITKEVPIETVKTVCYSGYTLPQKSTYFYPKAICGFLFGSIDTKEFESFFDSHYE